MLHFEQHDQLDRALPIIEVALDGDEAGPRDGVVGQVQIIVGSIFFPGDPF